MIKKIAIAAAVLAALGTAGYIWMVHSLDKALESAAPQINEVAVAMKGALGETIFDPPPAEIRVVKTNKTGLDALFDSTENDDSSPALLDAYKRNPDKFRRYAEMVDTAMRAKQLAVLVEARTIVTPIESTTILNLPAELRRDVWNNPYCIFQVSEGLAVVSGVVRGKAGTCKLSTKRAEEFARAKRPIFQSESGEVVVISRKDKRPS